MHCDQVNDSDKCHLSAYENTCTDNAAATATSSCSTIATATAPTDSVILDASQLNELACGHKYSGQLIHLNKHTETVSPPKTLQCMQSGNIDHMSHAQLPCGRLRAGSQENKQCSRAALLDDNITTGNDDAVDLHHSPLHHDDRHNSGNKCNNKPTAAATATSASVHSTREQLCASRITREYMSTLPPHVTVTQQIKHFHFWKSIRTEFMCTFIFMLVAITCNVSFVPSAAVSSTTLPVDLSEIKCALCVAAVTCILMNMTNHQIINYYSSCHLNPCLTLALYITGHNNQCVTFIRLLFLTLAQIVASVTASAFMFTLSLNVLSSDEKEENLNDFLSPPHFHHNLHATNLFTLELVGTFIVILTYLSVTDLSPRAAHASSSFSSSLTKRSKCKCKCNTHCAQRQQLDHHYLSNYHSHSFTLVALALATGHLLTFKLTGGALNPIRMFGPALITNHWHYHWVYWIAPAVASLVASFTYEYIKSSKSASPVSPCTRDSSDRVDCKRTSTFLPIHLTDDEDEDEDDDEQSTSSHHASSGESVTRCTSKSNSIHRRAVSQSIRDEGMLMTSSHNDTCESDDDDDDRHHHADSLNLAQHDQRHQQLHRHARRHHHHHHHERSNVSVSRANTSSALSPVTCTLTHRNKKPTDIPDCSGETRAHSNDTKHLQTKEEINSQSVGKCKLDRKSTQSSGVSCASSSSSFSSSGSSSSNVMTELKLISPCTPGREITHITSVS